MQSASSRAILWPAAARRSRRRDSSSSSSSSPVDAALARVSELNRAQRLWQEPQVARLQWSIVRHPVRVGAGSDRRCSLGARRHASTKSPLPPPPPPVDAHPPPLPPPQAAPASPHLVSAPPSPLPTSSRPSPNSRPRSNAPPPPAAAALKLPSVQRRTPLGEPAPAPPPLLKTPPVPPSLPRAPGGEASGHLEQSVLEDQSASVEADAVDAVDPPPHELMLVAPLDRPSGGARSSGVHPASFFGPQTARFPIKVSAPRLVPPIVSLNPLLPPPAQIRPRPSSFQRPAPYFLSLTSFPGVVRPELGQWISRSPSRGRDQQPQTRDGLPFRAATRGIPAVAAEDASQSSSFALLRSKEGSKAQQIVGEMMEVMEYAPLPAPYLRPDVKLSERALTAQERQLTNNFSKRLIDQSIKDHCVARRLEEALELFAHTYPGWLPWTPPSTRQRTPAADVDESVVYELSLGLIRTGSADRARELLGHVSRLPDFQQTIQFHHAVIKLYIGLREYKAAQAQFDLVAQMPGDPLSDPVLARPLFRTLMSIGGRTATPEITLFWLSQAEARGLKPDLRDLKELMFAYASVQDVPSVSAIWRTAQSLGGQTPPEQFQRQKMFDRCLRMYADMGASYRHISHFVARAINSANIKPTPEIYTTVMRVAAHEGDYDAAREIMRTMEHVGVDGVTFPAERRHYEALLLALDRQLPHRRVYITPDTPNARQSREERAASAVELEKAWDRVLQRFLDLVIEMKERNIDMGGSSLVRLTRVFAYRPTTRIESVRMAMTLMASLPEKSEGWSSRNSWAMTSSSEGRYARTSPALRVFSSLIKALSNSEEADNYTIALQAFDHFAELNSVDQVSVVDIAVLLSLSGRADETRYIERLWEMAVKRATETSVPIKTPIPDSSSDADDLRLSPSTLLEHLNIPIPTNSASLPHRQFLSPAMATLLRVVNQQITSASLLYLEKEWLRVYQLGFGFDAACWCELARAYLGAGRLERGFQIVNDVVLFRHHQLLREFESSHRGHTVPSAPSFAAAADEGVATDEKDMQLSDEIRRAPPHYQDMVVKSYRLPPPHLSQGRAAIASLRRRAIATCQQLYGHSSTSSAVPVPSIPSETLAHDEQVQEEIACAVSWAPLETLAAALEEAQETIDAEARRRWKEEPDDSLGENPLQVAKRFLDNYPRVQHLLKVRADRKSDPRSSSFAGPAT